MLKFLCRCPVLISFLGTRLFAPLAFKSYNSAILVHSISLKNQTQKWNFITGTLIILSIRLRTCVSANRAGVYLICKKIYKEFLSNVTATVCKHRCCIPGEQMQHESMSKCDQNTWRKVGIPVPILNLFRSSFSNSRNFSTRWGIAPNFWLNIDKHQKN